MKEKNLFVAYLYLIFLGPTGSHNFYAERKKLAYVELSLPLILFFCIYWCYDFGESFFHVGKWLGAISDFSAFSSGVSSDAKVAAVMALCSLISLILLPLLLLYDLFALPSAIRLVQSKNQTHTRRKEMLEDIATSAMAGAAAGALLSDKGQEKIKEIISSSNETLVPTEEVEKMSEDVGMTVAEMISDALSEG